MFKGRRALAAQDPQPLAPPGVSTLPRGPAAAPPPTLPLLPTLCCGRPAALHLPRPGCLWATQEGAEGSPQDWPRTWLPGPGLRDSGQGGWERAGLLVKLLQKLPEGARGLWSKPSGFEAEPVCIVWQCGCSPALAACPTASHGPAPSPSVGRPVQAAHTQPVPGARVCSVVSFPPRNWSKSVRTWMGILRTPAWRRVRVPPQLQQDPPQGFFAFRVGRGGKSLYCVCNTHTRTPSWPHLQSACLRGHVYPSRFADEAMGARVRSDVATSSSDHIALSLLWGGGCLGPNPSRWACASVGAQT